MTVGEQRAKVMGKTQVASIFKKGKDNKESEASMRSAVRTGPKPSKQKVTYFKKVVQQKARASKICPAGKAWAKRTFDTYPSAYANMAASKYCKDPNYAKGAKGKKKG